MHTTPLSTLSAAAALSLALGACHQANSQAGAPARPAPEVAVYTVQAQDVPLTTTLPGRTAVFRVSEVRPQVTGILQKRLFEEGTEVKAGQPLYQIDPATYRATLDQAEATLESARLLSERYDKLIERQAISQQDRDDARSQYLQAKAAVETARINVGYTRITAPISGRIGRSAITEGALVTANQTTALSTVQQLDPIYVDIVQPSTAILQLKDDLAAGRLKNAGNGQAEVHLTLENGKAYAQAGKLQFSEVSVDEGTGAVTLRAVFPNPEHTLLPGMFVRAQLQEGIKSQALLVPQRGVTRDATGAATAMVLGEGNKVEPRSVAVDRAVGTNWLVSNGLKVGDRVIVDGLQNIRPGMQVNAVPAPAASAPASATVAQN
jgi:membrane fusion protein (multidrug efflux system)